MRGYQVIGLSRSPTSISHEKYQHFIQDVTSDDFKTNLSNIISSLPRFDLCVYCAGIGDVLRLDDLEFETKVFRVNLLCASIATEVAVTEMLRRQSGHFIGLSSILDNATSAQAPSYCASKAGISRYWSGLGLALENENVHVSNVRLGFVDTKMAKGHRKPFLMTTTEAAEFIFEIIQKPRVRATKPILMMFLFWLWSLPTRLKLVLS